MRTNSLIEHTVVTRGQGGGKDGQNRSMALNNTTSGYKINNPQGCSIQHTHTHTHTRTHTHKYSHKKKYSP